MIGCLLLALAALGAEPAWIVEYTVPATAGPPEDACGGAIQIASPGVARPAVPVAPAAAPSSPETAGMLRYDLAPGAANDQLPAEIRARLGLGAPLDLHAIALEPLRGEPTDLARVRDVLALAARRERVTRLSFWGASHVAGEFFTGELRRVLQDRYGDAGHGFVMPAAPWTGYRASDINLCSRGPWVSDYDNRRGGRSDGLFGPGGISVEATTPESVGWVQTTKTNPHGRAASRLEVLFLRQPGGGTLNVTVDAGGPIPVSTAGPVGPGGAVLHVNDGPHRLTVSPAGDGPVRVFGVVLERDAPGIVVDAMGVSGRTASSWLHWDEPLMGAYLRRRTPDLVVLAYGTNEANDRSLTETEYRLTLRAVLARMRRLLPETACVLIGPSDRGRKIRGTVHAIWGPTAWVARAQREIAPEFGCVSWDLQEATGGPGSIFRWRTAEPSLAAGDLIHFSAAGYRELAGRFLAAMGPSGAPP